MFPVTASNTPQVRSHGYLYLQKLTNAAYCSPSMMNYTNCLAINGRFCNPGNIFYVPITAFCAIREAVNL